MTIYDISEKAGVSIATVSRVLNGNANVKPKTKKKVMDVIEEYGYTPNAFARGLGLNTMNTIGILCADSSYIISNSFSVKTDIILFCAVPAMILPPRNPPWSCYCPSVLTV